MIPLKRLALEEYSYHYREYRQRYHFLYYLELHKVEGTSVPVEPYPVRWYLGAVFEKGYAPGEDDDEDQRPSVRDMHLLEFQMSVPGKGHHYVRDDKKKYCPEPLHSLENCEVQA